MNYTEEKFKVLGIHGLMVEVVKSEIVDEDTQEVKTCLRIQQPLTPKGSPNVL